MKEKLTNEQERKQVMNFFDKVFFILSIIFPLILLVSSAYLVFSSFENFGKHDEENGAMFFVKNSVGIFLMIITMSSLMITTLSRLEMSKSNADYFKAITVVILFLNIGMTGVGLLAVSVINVLYKYPMMLLAIVSIMKCLECYNVINSKFGPIDFEKIKEKDSDEEE